MYVKENPKQDNSDRSRYFLAQLIKLDNVRLISQKEDTFNLIENCIAVATVTGTAAWEAMLIGKYAIFFGKHLNTLAPGAVRVRNNADCESAIRKVFSENSVDNDLIRQMKVFIASIKSISFKSYILSETPRLDVDEWLADISNTSKYISNKILGIFNYQ